MRVKFSKHALQRYSIRTALSPLEAERALYDDFDQAHEIDVAQATERFPITKIVKGDTYWLWYSARIKEHLLAIKRKDGTVATILSEHVFSSKRRYIPANIKIVDGNPTRVDGWLVQESCKRVKLR